MTTGQLLAACLFRDRGIEATVELRADEAPAACAALWDRLPMETDTYHSKWGGQQVFLVLPPFRGLRSESPTAACARGDVLLYHRDATDRTAPRHLRAAGLADYTELAICYGLNVRAFGPAGAAPVTRIGRVIAGLDALAATVREMRRAGFEPMSIRRRD